MLTTMHIVSLTSWMYQRSVDDREALGLMSQSELIAELEAAKAAGHAVAVLFPSSNAVDADTFAKISSGDRCGSAGSLRNAELSTAWPPSVAQHTLLPPLLEENGENSTEAQTNRIALATARLATELKEVFERVANIRQRTAACSWSSSRHVSGAAAAAAGWEEGASLFVVVLDSTYRQARQLNRNSIPSWMQRIKITPRGRSKFAPLRNGGDLRAEAGRTSTFEAVAMLLEALEPGFLDVGHAAAWGLTLELMVDVAKRQRGLPSVYGNDDAVESDGRFFSTTEQMQPGKVQRPESCPHCAANTGGFRNLGRCRGDRDARSWLCKTCKRRFTVGREEDGADASNATLE